MSVETVCMIPELSQPYHSILWQSSLPTETPTGLKAVWILLQAAWGNPDFVTYFQQKTKNKKLQNELKYDLYQDADVVKLGNTFQDPRGFHLALIFNEMPLNTSTD